MVSPTQTHLPPHTTPKRDRLSHPRWYSNSQFQRASGRSPTLQTAWALGSVNVQYNFVKCPVNHLLRRVHVTRHEGLLVSSCLNVRPSVRPFARNIAQITVFRGILYWRILRKSITAFQIWLKSNSNIGLFT